jgi:hypothetical protein
VLVPAVVLLSSAAVWGLLMLRADAHHEGPVGNPADYGPLTADQYAAAVRIAQREVTSSDAHLSSATAIVERGRVRTPNLSSACTSGRVIRIQLVGRFPHLILGGPGQTGPDVERFVADAVSGQACDVAVGAGHVKPYRHSADLLPALTQGTG